MTARGTPVRTEPGTIDAALANGRQLLLSNPDAAALQARTILRSSPDSAPACRLLSQALRMLGEEREAQAAMNHALHIGAREPAFAAIVADLRMQRWRPALKAARALRARAPDDPLPPLLLGEALLQAADLAKAAEAFEAVVRMAPGYPPGHLGLARARHLQFDIAAARAALAPLLVPASGAIDDAARFEITLRSEAGDYAAAEHLASQLAAAEPRRPELNVGHGDILRTLGHRSAAEVAYRRALAVEPLSGRAWWGVANVHKGALPAADRAAIERAADRATDPAEAILGAFAAAASHRADSDASVEMHWLERGNTARRRTLQYDETAFEKRMSDVRKVASERFFSHRGEWGDPSDAPIFIVGPARSGSTLLERMLGCHSAIEACGELPLIPALIREAEMEIGVARSGDLAELLKRLTRAHCRRYGAEYLRRSQIARREGKPHFIDKLPHNWAEAAFVRLILPKSTIIDIRRHPLDCVVSNYRTAFAPGHPASYDLVEMAGYYAICSDAMDAFRSAAPSRYARVVYERLTETPESELTAILEKIGLAFEPACLEFAKAARPVSTASAEQVGRPLNQDGVNIRQRFEQWLGAAKARLGPVLDTWDN